MAQSTQAVPIKKLEKRSEAQDINRWRESLGRWAFVLPVLLINLVVVVIPSVIGLAVAFTEWSGYGIPTFIGLENFQRLFQDDIFFKALKNNLIWTGLFLTAPIAIGLTGAYILSTIKRGQMFFRVA